MRAKAKEFSKTEWVCAVVALCTIALLNVLLPAEIFYPIFLIISILFLFYYGFSRKHFLKIRVPSFCVVGYFLVKLLVVSLQSSLKKLTHLLALFALSKLPLVNLTMLSVLIEQTALKNLGVIFLKNFINWPLRVIGAFF